MSGSAFKSVQAATESLRGKEFMDRVRAAVPGEAGDALRFGGVMSSGWYPVSWFRSLYGVIVQLEGRSAFAREVGRASTRIDAGTVLRVFFRMMSVPFLLSQGARVFRMYFEGAELDIRSLGPRVASVRWQSCHGFDRNLWQDQLGTIEELFVLSAGKELSELRVLSGGGDTDSSMEIEGRWG